MGSDYEFIPMVFEATGGINNEGRAFFAKLLLAARNFQSDPHPCTWDEDADSQLCVAVFCSSDGCQPPDS